MREYTKVSPGIWRSKAFLSLQNDRQRLLYLYLLTSAHQTSAGCCVIPDGYACADLQWEFETYRQERSGLQSAKLILADDDTSEILICGWFFHNAPQNEKHRIGTSRLIDKIQSDALRKHASEALETAWSTFVKSAQERALGRTPQRSMMFAIDGRKSS